MSTTHNNAKLSNNFFRLSLFHNILIIAIVIYNSKTMILDFKKLTELEELCGNMGNEGWELVSVNYDWFMVSYTLFFKKNNLMLF